MCFVVIVFKPYNLIMIHNHKSTNKDNQNHSFTQSEWSRAGHTFCCTVHLGESSVANSVPNLMRL